MRRYGGAGIEMRRDQHRVVLQRIELIPLGGPDGAVSVLPMRERIARMLRRNTLFLLLVALPTLVAAIYFLAIAGARYESEVQFVVRSPATSASNQLSGLVPTSSSIMRSSDDAYIVQAYIRSRDAMNALIADAQLMEAFQRPEVDFLWRYPPLFRKPTAERLYTHYLRFISVDYDQSTGVVSLTVQAFQPGDAQRIAQALLKRSEALINSLNERSGADAIDSALKEVQTAEQRAHEALDAVTGFRNRMKTIDPAQTSLATFNTIASLSLDTAETNATLTDVEKETPGGPQVAALKRKIDALQQQITAEMKKLAGSSTSLAPQLAEYESLALNQNFAEQAFVSALATLESARVDSVKQHVFVEPVTTANLPDYPAQPRRLLWMLAIFATSFITWRIVRTFFHDTVAHGGS
jgi:capsular polysaccharide transport system permease protein